jgi:microcystin degradation protein MlrC
MIMRIAIARISHEANTFNPTKTTMNDFLLSGYYIGQEILDRYYSDELSGCIAGFIPVLNDAGVEIVPLITLGARMRGVVTQEALTEIKERLVISVKRTKPLDGILLNMHGAMVSEEQEDMEGYLIEKVREVVGPEIPIVVTFDIHAFITKRKIKNTTSVVGYHTYPHLDSVQTGERAAKLLLKILNEGIKPEIGYIKLPMIAPPENTSTEEGAFKEIFKLIHESEENETILSSSLFTAQPWMDIQNLGWDVLIYGYDKMKAEKWTKKIARECWLRKEEFLPKRTPIKEAIREAASYNEKPVIISDTADSAGAPGDSTMLLGEMLRQKIRCEALITVVDPGSVKVCNEVGVGKLVRLKLGGKIDPFSEPLDVEGKVRLMQDGHYVLNGREGYNGLTAVLQIRDIKVVITEYPPNGAHPITYRSVGLEPKNAQIVVVKSPRNFRAHYSPFASKFIIPETQGLATPDFKQLPFVKIPRPFYPFDEEEKFQELRKRLQIG